MGLGKSHFVALAGGPEVERSRSTLSAMVTEYLLSLGRIQLGGLGLRPDLALSAQPVIACPALGTAFLFIKMIRKGRDLRFLVDIRLFWRIRRIFFSH